MVSVIVQSPPQLLDQIELQKFCHVSGMSLQHSLLTHGNPVTGRERRVVEPHSPTHDLHRSIALVIHK
jgi:hypothetical protein